jgi:hypothetical protein
MAPKTKTRSSGKRTAHLYDMAHIPQTLSDDFAQQQALFRAQRPITQRFIEAQAQALAEAVMSSASQVRFKLPDEVAADDAGGQMASLPQDSREQMVGRLLDGLTHPDLRSALRHHLLELESASSQAVAISAGLLRFATASHLVHQVLPEGRAVQYAVADDEEIPAIPVGKGDGVESAITAETDAIAESGPRDKKRGELLVPYVKAALNFYLPQWVAFDDQGHPLMSTVQEAEGQIASMQRFISVLHMAVGLAPYIVADEEYQRKRYGILGQLVNQGRALARYQTQQIIEIIQQRAARGDLNRGLSLSLPYFDDQELAIKLHHFQVTPSGRIMFVPGFVTRAAEEERAKVAQDTRLNPSTRKYLIQQLELLAQAFEPSTDQ